MQTVAIEGKVRTSSGKTASKALRKQGIIPCTLYGKDLNVSFEVPESVLRGIIYTPDFFKVQLNIDGDSYETLIKDMQFDPVTDQVIHMDFYKLEEDKPRFLRNLVRDLAKNHNKDCQVTGNRRYTI